MQISFFVSVPKFSFYPTPMFPLKTPGIKGSLKPKTLRVSQRIIRPYPPNSDTTP